MRIYHPLSSESWLEGGVKVSALNQRKALELERIDYVTDPDEDYDVFHLNFITPRSLHRIRKAQRDGKKVVVHAHSLGENIAGTHHLSHLMAPLVKRYYTRIYREADLVVAVSGFVENELRRKGVETPVEVVSNGVDGKSLDGFQDLEVRDRHGIENFSVVNLSQVYEVKGVDSFNQAASRMPDADFTWFGPRHPWLSPFRTKLRLRLSPGNARYPGFVDDKREAFASGDAFLFPSRRETQGISVLEAAYCGMPVVVRDIPAFDGWLEHGENCLKARDVEGFVEQLERLKNDGKLRQRLGGNAEELAQEHTLDVIGSELREVYERVLEL